MKNIKLILLLLPLIGISCSQRNVVLSEDNIPADIFYLKDEIKPFNGKCVVYFEGTKIVKEKMKFKNGILNGERISYYKNGQIKHTGRYIDGTYNGTWMGYDPEGNKLYEVEYINDTLIGRFITWYSTGVIKEKGSYNHDHKEGKWVEYDQAGMIVAKKSI